MISLWGSSVHAALNNRKCLIESYIGLISAMSSTAHLLVKRPKTAVDNILIRCLGIKLGSHAEPGSFRDRW